MKITLTSNAVLQAAQLRKAAADLIKTYRDDHRDARSEAAQIVGAEMCARADLMDAEAGTDTGVAQQCIIEQDVPLLGKIKIEGGRKIFVERPYNCEGEASGIYVDFQWCADPRAAERDGTLIRFWIGSQEQGPLAQYEASDGQWYALTSRGNYGKRYACGGNWSSKKIEQAPEIVNQLEKIMNEQNAKNERIAKAKIKLEAARLRLLAQSQRDMAAAYGRQATKPIYPEQAEICAGKGSMALSHADVTEARAALLLAEAGI